MEDSQGQRPPRVCPRHHRQYDFYSLHITTYRKVRRHAHHRAARALLSEPEVVLADEPTRYPAKARCQPVLELLRKLSERGRNVVIVGHETEVATVFEQPLDKLVGRFFPLEP